MTQPVIYRRWRPRKFGELIGQEHVVRTLQNELRNNAVGHAYLFCGPRGVGKTTTARIFAMAVNCLDGPAEEPCGECESCIEIQEGRSLDLIELDAASQNSVDDIRSLIEKTAYAPSRSRYKVYILDEAHMLSGAAANAFLKTLEEPPTHVVFILATTEPQKIIPTIVSRCQRFDFRPIPASKIAERLALICEREGVEVEGRALSRIARMANGSQRDAESILEQLCAYSGGRISAKDVESILGLPPDELVFDYVRDLLCGDIAGALLLIRDALRNGQDLVLLMREAANLLSDVLLIKVAGPERLSDLSFSIEHPNAFPQDADPELLASALELFAEHLSELERERNQLIWAEVLTLRACHVFSGILSERLPVSESSSSPAGLSFEEIVAGWPKVIEEVKNAGKNYTANCLRRARPLEKRGDRLVLIFPADEKLSLEYVTRGENKALVESVLKKVYGTPMTVECCLSQDVPDEKTSPSASGAGGGAPAVDEKRVEPGAAFRRQPAPASLEEIVVVLKEEFGAQLVDEE